ncbi:hypothetical protein BPNPMPFG_002416 [Mesorhizobium sp. AR07]|uniref:hypothetical protein n=1 Tax=Mesorhizobium sp. AR07 TaxID=2865838 RepID=UPI00220186B5|nr:hypothetical protein [Mesorhizobium sp. AR07]UVK46713.1 hypothetical protein BPNPMPFG_002416 [Mesorhizobium sp. AR07]
MPPSTANPAGKDNLAFLTGGGELDCLVAKFDWASTSIGPIETWPQSLKTSVSLILRSRVPIVMLWAKTAS